MKTFFNPRHPLEEHYFFECHQQFSDHQDIAIPFIVSLLLRWVLTERYIVRLLSSFWYAGQRWSTSNPEPPPTPIVQLVRRCPRVPVPGAPLWRLGRTPTPTTIVSAIYPAHYLRLRSLVLLSLAPSGMPNTIFIDSAGRRYLAYSGTWKSSTLFSMKMTPPITL